MTLDAPTCRALIAEMADEARIEAWNRYASIPHTDTNIGRDDLRTSLAAIRDWEDRQLGEARNA